VVTGVRIPYTLLILRDRAEEARKAHNLEVIGSNPIPATTKIVVCVCFVFFTNTEIKDPSKRRVFFCLFGIIPYICKTNKQTNMPDFNINQRFEFLQDLTSMVVCGVTPSLIVTGEGGLGKTHTVNSTIQNANMEPSEYTSFKGYSTARGLYNTLYDHNGKLIIFDDCDSVLEDKVAVNILKSALDSYETRQITWMAKMNRNDEYPQQFNFTGRIIFISNKDRSKIDGAILSRSLVVDLTMSPEEKIERMGFIINDILPEFDLASKIEALEFLDENKDKTSLNIRSLIMISKIRQTFPDTWRNLATYMINS
jgi:hypothetical protein